MKKIFIGLAIMALASCSYLKGDYTLGRRNTFNDFFYTYNIHYYGSPDVPVSSGETVTVSEYDDGQVHSAVAGGVVVAAERVKETLFSGEYVRPSAKGALVSYTVPVEFSDEKVYRIIGEVVIDEKTYRLIEPNRIGDVLILDDYGRIYPRVGRIYNDRLALLETSFRQEPADVIFSSESEKNAGGETAGSFQIRYMGIDDFQMVFEYNGASVSAGMSDADVELVKFPMYDKMVNIKGVKLEILSADENSISYKVLAL